MGWAPSHGLHACSLKPSSSLFSYLVESHWEVADWSPGLGSASASCVLGGSFPSLDSALFSLKSSAETCLLLSLHGMPLPHLEPPTSFAQGVILSCRSPEGIVSFHAGRERSKIIFFNYTAKIRQQSTF